MSNRKYTWKPDTPDFRDHTFAAPLEVSRALPPAVDLRGLCPAVYDQLRLGSCTANAAGAAFEFDLLKQHVRDFMPSRLFIYYNERVMEGTVAEDSGAMIRDGVKSLAKLGVCSEEMWPYSDENPGPFQRSPTTACYQEAAKRRVVSYARVHRGLSSMKSCLASGYPFIFGFSVFDSFESDEVTNTGLVQLPNATESCLGGHAVLCVGYDTVAERFIVRNSWGPRWGVNGYFTMPFAYLLDEGLSDDFWTLRAVVSP